MALPRPPDLFMSPCAQPTPLPDKALSGADIVKYWGPDRVALAVCRERYARLSDHIDRLAKLYEGQH